MIGRIAYSVLAGVVAYIIMVILGQLLNISVLTQYAVIVGVLVAAVYFFSRVTPPAL
jgi:DNA integrity scanning protein DisA with diadenylate cyclase activity